ncbi:MAG: hypothetical protein SPL73_05590 [Cyanobacteriota bacterium]|nr:hypothetical protein [Cyanobacteriota bacterium]MDY6364344.1 hypothetical protein [Cyanobacteriota bacterium]
MFYKVFFWVFIIGRILLFIFPTTDATDKNFFKRSDLELHTDYGTGNQYLSTWTGFLVPRLDKNGKQMNIYTEDNNAR